LLRQSSSARNLAERIAFFVSQDGSERKRIIARVRAAYGFRSNYLHHGEAAEEYEEIKEFLLTTWGFYSQVLANWMQFKERLQFVNTIDDVKLGVYDRPRTSGGG
jgi:hypothetical protein